jgi:hypothetical protein
VESFKVIKNKLIEEYDKGEREYNVMTQNCEHFVTELLHEVAFSEQAEAAQGTWLGTLVAVPTVVKVVQKMGFTQDSFR